LKNEKNLENEGIMEELLNLFFPEKFAKKSLREYTSCFRSLQTSA